jgi:ribosomal protein S17E
MAGIKSALVKRTSRQLMEKDLPFEEDFDTNKKLLAGTLPSKKVRNKIAGYLVRLKKIERTSKIIDVNK